MPWQIDLIAEHSIIETHYRGLLTPGELVTAAVATLARVDATGMTRLLGDCTALLGGHTVGDLYDLADLIVASPQAERIREAVLLPGLPGPADDVRFWETACINRGLAVKLFDDRAAAIAWLAA